MRNLKRSVLFVNNAKQTTQADNNCSTEVKEEDKKAAQEEVAPANSLLSLLASAWSAKVEISSFSSTPCPFPFPPSSSPPWL